MPAENISNSQNTCENNYVIEKIIKNKNLRTESLNQNPKWDLQKQCYYVLGRLKSLRSFQVKNFSIGILPKSNESGRE